MCFAEGSVTSSSFSHRGILLVLNNHGNWLMSKGKALYK